MGPVRKKQPVYYISGSLAQTPGSVSAEDISWNLAQMPVPGSGQAWAAEVLEIKVRHPFISPSDLADDLAAGTSSANESAVVFGTTDNTTALDDPSNISDPYVIAEFNKQFVVGAGATGGTVAVDFERDEIRSLQDEEGLGFVVATPKMYVTVKASGLWNSAEVKYRIKWRPIKMTVTRYFALIESQRGTN